MNKFVVGIVIVLALIVVGGFFYFSPQQENGMEENWDAFSEAITEREQSESGTGTVSLEDDMIEDIIVTYTDSGFEPRSITINQGQTVRFLNQSSRGLWVGSDSHPTHTLYPIKSEEDCLGSSFDTCESLPAGEAWSFRFDEAGSWGYHNHLQASHRGTVVVQ